jgi:myb proto-oncogene protein
VATRATGRWTTDEDAKLANAVANTSKKKWGNEYKIDWDAVAALVPGRTNKKCSDRWKNGLNPSIDRTTRRTGKWTAVEDIKLKDAVQMHGAKNWKEIAVLVPGRTRNQCIHRWNDVLDPSIDRATERMGKWAEDEDSKLKDAVQMHGDKDWVAVACSFLVERKCSVGADGMLP